MHLQWKQHFTTRKIYTVLQSTMCLMKGQLWILTKHLYMLSLFVIPGPVNPPYMYRSDPSFHVAKHSKSWSENEATYSCLHYSILVLQWLHINIGIQYIYCQKIFIARIHTVYCISKWRINCLLYNIVELKSGSVGIPTFLVIYSHVSSTSLG